MSQPTSADLPGARLVRSAHTKEGVSIFAADAIQPPFSPFGPKGSSFITLDRRDAVPVNNTELIPDLPAAIPRCPPGGAIFCITDIAAGFEVPMHRTESLDYAAVLSGEIVMRLDGGDERTVREGEFIVQQGANHQWINRTERACRILCVMLGAEKIVLENGTVLEHTQIPRKV